VRVFVSSTFRDMEAERDILAKRTFPELRERCRQRMIDLVEVDLRWGVTKQQTERGETLPICLEEIENCRPYFIGLLGERYGWVPERIDETLLTSHPWLREHLTKSITELEIIHGVLNNPEMASRSYFYFRDPLYAATLPEEERSGFAPGSPEEHQKLNELKGSIRAGGFPVLDDYPSPEDACEKILDDLWTAIDTEFPEGSEPDPLEREAAEHEAFAESRARAYVGRPEYFERLDAHAAGDGLPLVILGESGLGKSALLANWARRYRRTHPDVLVLQHYIGSTPQSADYFAILRRLMGELKRRLDIEQDLPDAPEEVRRQFPNWLGMAAAKSRVVLILDGLNQIEDRDNAPDLHWLPETLPSGCRVLLSTLPGRSFDALEKRDWPMFTIEPLSGDECRELVSSYLARYRKNLSSEQLERIVSHARARNPLYLRVLLEELRVFGSHEELDARIDHYLAAPTIDALYGLVLGRLEADHNSKRPGLVEDATSLIWASRRGLAESELLELLGEGGERLPQAVWSPLFLALRESLVTRSGLLTFFHDYLREAVRSRYMPDEDDQTRVRLRLAGHFNRYETTNRKVEELPWQLARAGEWERLFDLLRDPAFLGSVWRADEYDAKVYWSSIEAEAGRTAADAYVPLIEGADSHNPADLQIVARLLTYSGHPADVIALLHPLVSQYREVRELYGLHASLGELANALRLTGDLDGALALYQEQEAISREVGDKDGIQSCLGNQAVILEDRSESDRAMALHEEQARLCRELGNMHGLQASLANRANILWARGEHDGAMVLQKEVERICRVTGNKDGLQGCFGNQAIILYATSDLDGAMKLFREQERICRELGDKNSLQTALGNRAMILRTRSDFDGALALLCEEERVCREVGNRASLAATLGNMALILWDRGDYDGAMALHQEEEQICRELGDKNGLQRTFGNQGNIHRARGDTDRAMALLEQQERICREIGNRRGLHAALGNRALILADRGDLDGAMKLNDEEENICRELGDDNALQRCLGNQAYTLKARGDLDGAMKLHEEEERICRELGNRASLARSLASQAVILYEREEFEGALPLITEAEQICRDIGDRTLLPVLLGNHALVLTSRGDHRGALPLLREQWRVCREAGNSSLIRWSLKLQAHIFLRMTFARRRRRSDKT
jgi:tetratricopeptide (TPR) repeat protein